MRINNNSYTDRLMRDEFMAKYSRTAQALNVGMTQDFNITLEDAIRRRTENAGPDTLIANAAQDYAKARNISGRYDPAIMARDIHADIGGNSFIAGIAQRVDNAGPDTLIANAAQDYARVMDISGRYDPVFADSSRNGELA